MRFSMSFVFLFLWSITLVDALSFTATKGIELRTSPLIGGPSWFPVHVKVVIDDKHVFDYVPLNPTSKQTMKKLVYFQAVPAEARIMSTITNDDDDQTIEYVHRAQQFCELYSKDLHLLYTNCWMFSFKII